MPEQINFPFTGVQLTEAINLIPNQYGLLNALNLMPSEGIISTIVQIYRDKGLIQVLPQRERGGPASVAKHEKAKAIFLEVPHFPHMDLITPEDLQNMLKIESGQVRGLTLEDELVKRLNTIRSKHDITREFMRMGALKGLIKDGDGETIYNLYDVFGITPKTVDFELDDDTTSVLEKCEEVTGHIQDNLLGETMTQVESIVAPSFFNKLVQHPNVEKFYLSSNNGLLLAQQERQKLGGQWGRVFEFGEILFREYRGFAPIKSGNEPFVAPDTGHAYPIGTQNAFRTFDAPANKIQSVNKIGEQINITEEILKHGQGVELHSESNPLPISKRPEVLVTLTA